MIDNTAFEGARSWTTEPPEPHLSFELLEDKALLILEPKGALEAHDFERLSAEVDPYIEKAGHLAGMMIVAEHFPGWDGLAGLTSHLQFVREHHEKVRRVALVTNDRLVSALPRFSSRFVAAEIRVFPMASRDDALLWAAGD